MVSSCVTDQRTTKCKNPIGTKEARDCLKASKEDRNWIEQKKKIDELKKLEESGLITKEEAAEKRKAILGSL